MLPKDAVVFLVDADRLRDSEDLAAHRVHVRVEIGDIAEAVAAELQRIRELAEAVLADVEHILARVREIRRAVRHHHLHQRRTMQHGAPVIADVV